MTVKSGRKKGGGERETKPMLRCSSGTALRTYRRQKVDGGEQVGVYM